MKCWILLLKGSTRLDVGVISLKSRENLTARLFPAANGWCASLTDEKTPPFYACFWTQSTRLMNCCGCWAIIETSRRFGDGFPVHKSLEMLPALQFCLRVDGVLPYKRAANLHQHHLLGLILGKHRAKTVSSFPENNLGCINCTGEKQLVKFCLTRSVYRPPQITSGIDCTKYL